MVSRLATAASPYLRLHADNPVAWYPWGEEAFAEARRRDVPVLVSIGYATCHWCHVMARESFADAATAARLNAGFVCIKVDREEHPEVDEAYLAAASAFTPHLGWPLTVFTTPAGRAFYAGTYFPPAARPGLPAFAEVLSAVTEAWTRRRGEVEQTAEAVVRALGAASDRPAADAPPSAADLADAARRLAAREDPQYGGFAGSDASLQTPKFPTVPALRFLQASRGPVAEAGAVADRALAAMARSPLRDPVDGGFFRYATRRDWTVPHYERMLTDNAGLIDVALDAGRHDLAAGIAAFLIDVLQQPEGGFAAAQDSESWIDGERSEGGYYLRDAAARRALHPPAIDAKIVTGWNGLAIGALARAGLRLGEESLVAAARWAADAVIESAVGSDGRLRRATLGEIVSPAAAVLEDYGLLAGGLTALAAATGEAAYADVARRLVDACLGDDAARDGEPRVPGGGDPVLAAQGAHVPDDTADGDHPAGPAALADAALQLWLLGAGERYRDAATAVVRRHAASALAEPIAHGALLRVATGLVTAPRQVVVVREGDGGALLSAARTLRAELFAVVTAAQAQTLAAHGFALFAGRDAPEGRSTLYDCEGFVCRLPVTDAAALSRA